MLYGAKVCTDAGLWHAREEIERVGREFGVRICKEDGMHGIVLLEIAEAGHGPIAALPCIERVVPYEALMDSPFLG